MPKLNKMIPLLAVLGLAAPLLMAGDAAAQQRGQPGRGPVAASCANDIATLCPNASHGDRSVRACLDSNRAKVSAACASALDNTGGGRGRRQGNMPVN